MGRTTRAVWIRPSGGVVVTSVTGGTTITSGPRGVCAVATRNTAAVACVNNNYVIVGVGLEVV